MRVRPAAKLTIILIIFAAAIGAFTVLKSNKIVEAKPIPTLGTETKTEAAVEPVVKQEVVESPVAQPVAPVTVAPASQEQSNNAGFNKLIQSGKR